MHQTVHAGKYFHSILCRLYSSVTFINLSESQPAASHIPYLFHDSVSMLRRIFPSFDRQQHIQAGTTYTASREDCPLQVRPPTQAQAFNKNM